MIFEISKIKEKYVKEIRKLDMNWKAHYPRLACLYSDDEAASLSFVKSLKRMASEVNISISSIGLSGKLLWILWNSIIEVLNNEEDIHGILLISPPPHISSVIDSKNVEGNDFDDRIDRISCTALAISEISEEMIKQSCDNKVSNYPLSGKQVVIIGYGKAVGKPLSYLLMRKHVASVTMIHKYTNEIIAKKKILEADIIVSATGMPGILETIISPDEIQNKYIIDAGIAEKEGKIVGDIDTKKFEKNNMITQVPGGVGVITTALILYNTAKAAHGHLR